MTTWRHLTGHTMNPYTWVEKFESFERINSIRETNGNFDSCNSCKRLVPSRLHELHESKFPFVSRIEFIRSKLSIFLLMYTGSMTAPESGHTTTFLKRQPSDARALAHWMKTKHYEIVEGKAETLRRDKHHQSPNTKHRPRLYEQKNSNVRNG